MSAHPKAVTSTPATDRFQWWHDAVFGPYPCRHAIPHQILRDYLDEQAAIRKFRPGLFNFRVTMSKTPLQVRVGQSE
jgi:hypothetical protein